MFRKMFRRTISTSLLTAMLLVTAALAFGGIPDLSNSTVSWAYEGTETLSLFNLPDGSGHSFERAFLPGTADGGPGDFVDATITLTLLDGAHTPIVNFPFEDLWLQSADGGMSPCIGGTTADDHTDFSGQTTWRYPLRAGGWSEAAMQVNISGFILVSGDLPLKVNSPDINGDGIVNLSDIPLMASSYFGPYHYRADFNYDGVLNLSDVGYFFSGWLVSCP